MSKRNRNITTSDFYCVKCGTKGIPIMRKAGGQREAGHLKRLYCLNCKEVVNHAEIRPFGEYNYNDFLMEFKLGRFLEDGTKIPTSELLQCTNNKCEYNIEGKCWNSNNSYECKYKPNLKKEVV